VNFRRYTFSVPFGALAENLVNSHDESLEVPEHLGSPADLVAFLAAHGIRWPRRPTPADLAEVRTVRGQVRRLFTAASISEAANALNQLLRDAKVNMAVARERGAAQIEWTVDTSLPLAEALRSAVAVSVAHLATTHGFERLRTCGADPCADVFLDDSKRGEQRFCSPRCATRVRVAAHRAREGS
jgi:predicted RNA-binding Zn ribbon-like protein